MLCSANTEFLVFYHASLDCLPTQSDNSKPIDRQLQPLFKLWLAYCNPLSTSTATTTGDPATAPSTLVTTIITALGLNNATAVEKLTVLVPVAITHVAEAGSDLSPLSTAGRTTADSGTYGVTPPPILRLTLHPLRLARMDVLLNSTLEQTPTSFTSSSSSSSPSSSTSSTSQAWIAGPVLGSLATLAIVLGVAYFILVRRRQRKLLTDKQLEWPGKPELHSDGPANLPPDGNQLQEADAQALPPRELEWNAQQR